MKVKFAGIHFYSKKRKKRLNSTRNLAFASWRKLPRMTGGMVQRWPCRMKRMNWWYGSGVCVMGKTGLFVITLSFLQMERWMKCMKRWLPRGLNASRLLQQGGAVGNLYCMTWRQCAAAFVEWRYAYDKSENFCMRHVSKIQGKWAYEWKRYIWKQ